MSKKKDTKNKTEKSATLDTLLKLHSQNRTKYYNG